MSSSHFRRCQPYLDEGDSGFLKNGQMPRSNVEEFRMVMRLVGMDDKPPKVQTTQEIVSSFDGLMNINQDQNVPNDEYESDKSVNPVERLSPMIQKETVNFS